LFRALGLFLRSASADRKKAPISINKMGSHAGPGSHRRTRIEIAMDKINEQSAACVSSRCWMGDNGMPSRLALLRIWLERSRRRVTRYLATHPNRGVYRRGWINVHGRVCQRYCGYNGVPFDYRSANALCAPTF